MKKSLISFLLAVVLVLSGIPAFTTEVRAAGNVAINSTNFPDAKFRAYVSENFDLDGSGSLDADELGIDYLDVRSLGISKLKGIEHFTELACLICYGNSISSLDLSKNTKLTELYCWSNKLTSLNLSKNTALKIVYCDYNELTSLNVKACKVLEYLTCPGNKLTGLDISANTALLYLECNDNQLTGLNVTKNTALQYLYCDTNELTSLDVTKNTSLVQMNCNYNALTSLDISKNTGLKYLACSGNSLTSLDVTKNTVLEKLYCPYNQLTGLNVSKNTALTILSCGANPLKSLNVAYNTKLEILYCGETGISTVNVSKNTALKELYCQNLGLTSLDVAKNTNLEVLYCPDNALTTLSVAKNTALQYLACQNNALTSLDVSKNTALVSLFCDSNRFSTLGVSKNTALVFLSCENLGLEKLNVTNNPDLEYLYCSGNKLTALNISKNPHLLTAYRFGDYEDGLYHYETDSVYYDLQIDTNCTVYTAKPKITAQPANQTVAEGKKASFTVKATEAATYQWFYRTSSDGEWSAVSSAAGKKATDTLTTAARHNGYQYRCRVTNPIGSVYTDIKTLTVVTEKPSITTQPKNQTVGVGDTAKFSVKASGTALKYQWYYRTSSDADWTAVSAYEGKTANYSLTAAARHNGYQYRCKVTNPVGSVYTSVRTLTVVTAKPSIKTQPSDQTAKAGETVTFTVKANGAGLSYQWYYRASASDAWTAVSASSGKTASYSLKTADRHNGYQYRCKVTNLLGYVYTKTVTLTVN